MSVVATLDTLDTLGTVTVRPAEPQDMPWLLGELRDFDRFFGAQRSLVPDEAHAEAVLRSLIGTMAWPAAVTAGGITYVDEVRRPFFIADSDLGPIGFIAGTLGPHPFNPAIRVLSELLWWVTPAYRGSSAGARLLRAFRDYGQQHADWIVMTLEAESPVRPASLERLGFRAKETNYLFEVAR